MSKSPLVSIILPTYNGKEEWLSTSIDSILDQTFQNFELIIINDASTNNIEETILKYREKDPRIVYIKNDKNLQLTKSLNKGIEHSKGKYISRNDDDDIWIDNHMLEKQVEFMENNPDYGLCGAKTIFIINEKGETIGTEIKRTEHEEITNHLLEGNQFSHSSIIMRKSILDKVGLYNPKYNKAEDYELRCRIGIKSKFTNLKNIGIKYRINSNGICKKNAFYQKKLSFKICIMYRKYYPHFIRAIFFRIFADFLLPKNFINFLVRLKKSIKKL